MVAVDISPHCPVPTIRNFQKSFCALKNQVVSIVSKTRWEMLETRLELLIMEGAADNSMLKQVSATMLGIRTATINALAMVFLLQIVLIAFLE